MSWDRLPLPTLWRQDSSSAAVVPSKPQPLSSSGVLYPLAKILPAGHVDSWYENKGWYGHTRGHEHFHPGCVTHKVMGPSPVYLAVPPNQVYPVPL